MKALILILRRNLEDLDPAERAALEALYPQGVTYERIDPADCIEHDRICAEKNPAAVILPLDRPIPSLAMEHGVRHIALNAYGAQELLPMKVEFKRFLP